MMSNTTSVLFLLRILAVVIFGFVVNVYAQAPSNKAASPTAQSTVVIAKPKPYRTLSEGKLGVNENGKGLVAGSSVKVFTIKNIQGKPYPIQNAWKDKPALIVFYRGGWCPYCNMQVRELSVNYKKLQGVGVQPVLISVDSPDKTAMISAEYRIPFPVLSDPELIAHNAFNVVMTLDPVTLDKYKQYGINLQNWSGKDHKSIAVASAFLIDQKGRVRLSHALADYTSRPSVDQLIDMIKKSAASQ